jgi:hypothetical protein
MSGAPSDIREGDKVDEAALKDLIRAAVALNLKPKPTVSNLPKNCSAQHGQA